MHKTHDTSGKKCNCILIQHLKRVNLFKQDVVSSGKPIVLEQRDDQGRAAEVPLPQSEEHDEIAAQLERMEKGDDNDEGTAGDDSKGREGTYYCLVYPNSQRKRISSFH